MLVLKAVASATKTQVPGAQPGQFGNGSMQPSQGKDGGGDSMQVDNPALSPGISASKSLASFRSALSLSSSGDDANRRAPALKKARKSALRLNSILEGTAAPPVAAPEPPPPDDSADSRLGIRKTRSVRWNTPGELPTITRKDMILEPNSKKKKSEAPNWTAARLKSFKSFGRPHADDFGSGPRNATFGEFGGRPGAWGKDGRMSAHPTPMQDATMVDPLSGEVTKADKNATFNLGSARPMNSALTNSFSGNRPSFHTASGQRPSGMQRTATVLEMALRKSIN